MLDPSLSHFFGSLSRFDPPDGSVSLSVSEYRETQAFYERLFRKLFNRRGVLFHIDEFFQVGDLIHFGDKITMHFVTE